MNWSAVTAEFQANLLSFIAEFKAHLWTYLSMPLIAAMTGYFSKMLAVEMIFRPLEFIGIKPPYLGWQGVVPRKAEKMAGTAADLLLGRLIKPEELIGRLDPERMLKELERPLLQTSAELMREVGERYLPTVWNNAPNFARQAMIRRLQAEIPAITRQFWEDLRQNPNNYIDLRHMMVSNLVKDRALLNQILKKVGSKEFTFFRTAGLAFGLILGVVQLACWMIWHKPWLLPAFGAFIGLVSDWIALQMLFRPLVPVKVLGIRFQGLFISRQKEVARDYAAIIAKQLLTPANIVEEVLRGSFADRVADLTQRHITMATDDGLGIAKPLVVFALGTERFQELRQFMVTRLLELIPEASRHVEKYAMDALDINNTIVAAMERLTPEEFEGMLRPAFKEDEKTLVLAGAALGFLIGELQVHLML